MNLERKKEGWNSIFANHIRRFWNTFRSDLHRCVSVWLLTLDFKVFFWSMTHKQGLFYGVEVDPGSVENLCACNHMITLLFSDEKHFSGASSGHVYSGIRHWNKPLQKRWTTFSPATFWSFLRGYKCSSLTPSLYTPSWKLSGTLRRFHWWSFLGPLCLPPIFAAHSHLISLQEARRASLKRRPPAAQLVRARVFSGSWP